MIRQAISCDMCGAEMQHANHWFVAFEQGSELRVSGWSPRVRLRTCAKHLCGQTCLHKLVDEFVAHTAPARAHGTEKNAEAVTQHVAARRTSVRPQVKPIQPILAPVPLPQVEYVDEFESSARVIPTQVSPGVDGSHAAVPDTSAISSHTWRTEAWKREREREQNRNDQRAKPFSRKRSIV